MVQYIERNGKKYPYPIDEDGNKTLHPDAIDIEKTEAFIKSICITEEQKKQLEDDGAFE